MARRNLPVQAAFRRPRIVQAMGEGSGGSFAAFGRDAGVNTGAPNHFHGNWAT